MSAPGAGDAWVDALRLWWLQYRELGPNVGGALPPPGTVTDAFHAGYAAGAAAERAQQDRHHHTVDCPGCRNTPGFSFPPPPGYRAALERA